MKRELWWPAGLASVLGVTVLANIAVMVLAGRNGGAEAVPDYYRRAVAWDSTLADEARSRALGWQLAATLAAPAAGGSVFELVLRDATGAAIEGASVRVVAFAVARVGDQQAAALTAGAAGYYAAPLPVRRAEWFEVGVVARRGGEQFVARLRCLPGQACRAA